MSKKDMLFYVADKDMEETIKGLLHVLFPEEKLSEFCTILREREHDPGIYKNVGDFLRKFAKDYNHVMVFLDREGSGQDRKNSEEIEREIEKELIYNGWDENQVKVIVFDPELEIWLWIDSPLIAQMLGWDDFHKLKSRLIDEGLWEKGKTKPHRPKEGMELACKEKRIPRSSSILKKIAENIPLKVLYTCQDPSFRRFIGTLEKWFNKNWLDSKEENTASRFCKH